MPDTSKPAAKSAAKQPDPHEVGYFGNSPKSIPNSEFSLKTGPDSPSAASQIVDARRAQLEGAEASLTNDDPKKG
jgi:hypothetical protein